MAQLRPFFDGRYDARGLLIDGIYDATAEQPTTKEGREARTSAETRSSLITTAFPKLEKSGWRGLEFWYVHTIGGHDPQTMAARWGVRDVHDAYYDLRLRGIVG